MTEIQTGVLMDKNHESKKGFWATIGTMFDSISAKAKIIISAILGVFGFIAFFVFQRKKLDKEIFDLEIKKAKEEVEIEHAQKAIEENKKEISNLDDQAEKIIEEINNVEKPDANRDVSNEELDDFFDKRGF